MMPLEDVDWKLFGSYAAMPRSWNKPPMPVAVCALEEKKNLEGWARVSAILGDHLVFAVGGRLLHTLL